MTDPPLRIGLLGVGRGASQLTGSPHGRLVAAADLSDAVREVEEELRGAAEVRELYEAVRHQQPLTHDGAWGEATLEVCLAINESARTRTEIRLAG